MTCETLRSLVEESWRIEGLSPTDDEIRLFTQYHQEWLKREVVDIDSLEHASLFFTSGYGRLRFVPGMDVRVGNHLPPKGGPWIEADLRTLCEEAPALHPYVLHQRFEWLHPFLDGNGRVGRLLWAWAMLKRGWPIDRGFLHEWYYQSLDHWRRPDRE